jgi:hypothetical protein
MPASEVESSTFWLEYVGAMRKAYGLHPPVDPAVDPMWVAIDDWYRIIDAAVAKAVAEGFVYFECGFMSSRRRIALRFRHPDGRRFQRTLAVDERFMRHGKPLSITEIIDLKIAIQTMIFYESCEGAPEPKLIYR